MRIITLLLLLVITSSAHAEVYKCHTPSKKIVYQSTPCSSSTENQNIIEIQKLNPQQKEDAENRLKATEEERQALDKAAQARSEAAAAQWKAEAPQREAAAARQEAAAARREADALRQQMVISPYPMYLPYSYPRHGHNYDQSPTYNPNFSPSSRFPTYLSPSPSPSPPPYIPPYMPAPVFPSAR